MWTANFKKPGLTLTVSWNVTVPFIICNVAKDALAFGMPVMCISKSIQ